jgi:folate-binding protein YgfZ
VSGQDAHAFLQGLVTVDMRKLVEGKLVAGAFLNAKGRMLHDVLVAKRSTSDRAHPVFDMETDAESADDLIDMLKRYKLRRKVTIEQEEARKVFAVWSKESKASSEDELWFADPRPGHMLGQRVWSKTGKPAFAQLRNVDETVYHQVRIACGVSEGLQECADELPFVLNYDWWPGTLAFDKGCYTGQELIARTHFKGQVRKRAVPVVLSTERTASPLEKDLLPSFATEWTVKATSKASPPVGSAIEPMEGVETKVGEGSLLAVAPGGLNIGLAAFRDAQNVPLPGSGFKPTHRIKLEGGGQVEVCPIRPHWWPAVESI